MCCLQVCSSQQQPGKTRKRPAKAFWAPASLPSELLDRALRNLLTLRRPPAAWRAGCLPSYGRGGWATCRRPRARTATCCSACARRTPRYWRESWSCSPWCAHALHTGFVLACWGPCGGALVPCVRCELWPLCCSAAVGAGHGAYCGVTVEAEMPWMQRQLLGITTPCAAVMLLPCDTLVQVRPGQAITLALTKSV